VLEIAKDTVSSEKPENLLVPRALSFMGYVVDRKPGDHSVELPHRGDLVSKIVRHYRDTVLAGKQLMQHCSRIDETLASPAADSTRHKSPGTMTPDLYYPVLDCFLRGLPHVDRPGQFELVVLRPPILRCLRQFHRRDQIRCVATSSRRWMTVAACAIDQQGTVLRQLFQIFRQTIEWDTQTSCDVFLIALARRANI
jgi:hypothetical protein